MQIANLACAAHKQIINPLNLNIYPYSALLVTSYCARVGQGEVGGITHRVTCTWWLLGWTIKAPWFEPGGPILALAALTCLENATLTL